MTEVLKGQFTIDRARAREKLTRYQLANPYAYVLELVQAAILRGAEQIHFSFDSDDMYMRFEGYPFSDEDLTNLEMAVLEKADTPQARSRRQLAAGLLAAEALNPKLVIVDSQGGSRLEMVAGKGETLGPSRKTSPGTVIQLRERWHPKLLLKFWRNLRGRGQEQTLLKKHCSAARQDIFVNKKLVSKNPHGSSQAERFGEVEICEEKVQGWGGIIVGEPGQVEILCDGVLIETVPLSGFIPFRAVVSGIGLEKDLSGAAIQRNEAYQNMMTVISEARKSSLLKFSSEEHHQFAEECRQEILALGDSKKLRDTKSYPGCLSKLKIWRLANGESATFEQLTSAKEKHGFLPYSLEYHTQVELEDMPLIWYSNKEHQAAMKQLLYLRNVTRRLENLSKAQVNKEKWLSSPTQAKLNGKGYSAYKDIKKDGIRGQLGLRKTGIPAQVRLIKDGCLLGEIYPPNWPKGIDLVLEADFEPAPNYDGVKSNPTLARALVAGLNPLPELIERIAKPSSIPFFWSKTQATLDIVADYLGMVSQPNSLGKFLEPFQLRLADFPDLEIAEEWKSESLQDDSPLLDIRWLKTESGEQRSLRELKSTQNNQPVLSLDRNAQETLGRLLGEDFLKASKPSGRTPAELPTFVADESWLQEELFLAALRKELRSMNEGQGDILVSNIRLSRVIFSDRLKGTVVELDESGSVLLNRKHELITEAVSHYQENPSVLILVISVLLSALNRATPQVSDEQESQLQSALFDHSLALTTAQQATSSINSGAPCGYLEPICDSGYGTGWANDPSGLGLRFYLEPPRLQSKPLMIVDLNSPRGSGGHDFLFELPRELLDGRRLKIWACLIEPKTGELHTLSGSPRVFAPRLEKPAPPFGWFEAVTHQGMATGWCLDPNCPDSQLRVEFYIDGNHVDGEYIGFCWADQARPEVLELTGYSGNHGFSFQVPEQHLDGAVHKLWAYTFDAEKVSNNPLLKGAPLAYGARSEAPRVSQADLDTAQRVAEETRQAIPEVSQCEGRTSKGNRCKRAPQKGSRYCYQHFG